VVSIADYQENLRSMKYSEKDIMGKLEEFFKLSVKVSIAYLLLRYEKQCTI